MGKYWKEKVYALYKGENNVCDGTLPEIARQTGRSLESLRFCTRPAYRRRREEYKRKGKGEACMELVEIEEGLDDEA